MTAVAMLAYSGMLDLVHHEIQCLKKIRMSMD